jgi:D-arabinose 1-dehydrogenase-like Zn-dependent alcohol dehydrogenase
LIFEFHCRIFRTVLDLFNEGSIQPISPITKFDPSEIKEAFHHLHGDRRIGAVCIDFPQDPITFQADFYAEKISFRSDRSYLLVGGFGGLGKAAAMWLAERGAGSIIFLSRSAFVQAAANANLLRELDALGCSVQIVTGSVTDITTVENLVSNATKPIAGVLHLPIVSMVRSRWIGTRLERG